MATLQRKARITGLFYLGLALAGAAGFLTVRPMLFTDGDPQATLTNVAGNPALTRLLVVCELLIVLTQALAAAGFHVLFREKAPAAAAGIGAFGLVNAVVVLISAALLATAAGTPGGDAGTVQLLFLISGQLWTVGGIFFGLWLIPMGWAVLSTGLMPRALGWVLIAGGAGYVLSALLGGVDLLAVPASIGEFWIVGYLLFRGVREPARPELVRRRAGVLRGW